MTINDSEIEVLLSDVILRKGKSLWWNSTNTNNVFSCVYIDNKDVYL